MIVKTYKQIHTKATQVTNNSINENTFISITSRLCIPMLSNTRGDIHVCASNMSQSFQLVYYTHKKTKMATNQSRRQLYPDKQCRQYKAMLGIQAIRDILRETRPVESVMMLRHPFLQESTQNKTQVDYICLQRKPVVTDS